MSRPLNSKTLPDFVTLAREWLVRVQGHSRPANEEALAEELKRVFELGYDLGYADGTNERDATEG